MRTAPWMFLATALLLPTPGPSNAADAPRTTSGLVALYDFAIVKDGVIPDVSGHDQDLVISTPGTVRHRGKTLELLGNAEVRTRRPPTQIIRRIKATGEVTIEAWIQPHNLTQAGPARIVTLSRDSIQRNLTLGQEGAEFTVRLRSTRTSENGLPAVSSNNRSVQPRLTHVVYTRTRHGTATLYVNAAQAGTGTVGGEFSNWSDQFLLGLGDELNGSRPWRGTYHLVAIYDRALNRTELRANFKAGPSAAIASSPTAQAPPARDGRGLVALYDFAEPGGNVIRDRTGHSPDLTISNPEHVRRKSGTLEVTGTTTIRSDSPAVGLTDAVRRSGEISIEAWLEPAATDQSGPARIVTLSQDPNHRNFTLGQDGARYDVRLRTTETSTNGLPSLPTLPNSLKPRLTHVVYTRNRGGQAGLYLNGKPAFGAVVPGKLANWDREFRLGLGNELDGSRPWRGTLHLVAVYARALSDRDVRRNFQAGPTAASSRQPSRHARQADPKARFFETQVAPLLARHCLECHDAGTHEGGLVLSHRKLALRGVEGETVLVPGKAADSLLWHAVASDEMPHNRPPLTSDEKAILQQWINGGAVWSLDVIDPAVYAHAGGADRIFVRRLTVDEYVETVRATTGVDISRDARRLLPADLRADGFANTAYNLNIDLQHVDAYARLAQLIVSRMNVAAFADRFGRKRNFTQPVMRPLIARMGKWFYRGPLEDHEVSSLRGITTSVASAGGTVDEALAFVMEAMLQSPRFLYRIENQRGDGTAAYASQWELASRMSYLVWGGPPDESLFAAAEAGALDPETIEQQLSRMLEDPRAREHSARFATDWLNLSRLDSLRPNPRRFRNWNPDLADQMRLETLRFFDHVVWDAGQPLSALLNSQTTFLTPELAKHYGLKPRGAGFRKYDLSESAQRGGLLTQGSILTVGGDDASMVTRGLFVMHELLRGVVKDPPPCVDTTPVPTSQGVTNRIVAMQRITNSNCGGCHMRFEPLAFGLEKYDGLGSFREIDEHGNTLREDGEILFPGAAEPVEYRSAAEMMELLAGSPRVQESITWKLTQFCMGRPLGAKDAATVAKIHQRATRDGGTWQAVLRAIVRSDLVQMTPTEPQP